MSSREIFPKPSSIGQRDWGEEILLVLASEKYTLKKLTIRAGKKGGLQYHRKKDEAAFILSGEMILRFDCGDGNLQKKYLKKGDFFHIPPGLVHQEEAVTDVEIIEVSTPHFNDRVRVETKYGMKEKKGLKSTLKREVVLR